MKQESEDPVHADVMEATMQTLASEGYSGFTMRKVAARTDVSKSTLHYRYDTKEGLLAAFLEFNAAQTAQLFEAVADKPPLERLVAILDSNLDAIEEPAIEGLLPAYIEVHANAARTEAFREKIWESEQRYRDELEAIIEAGIAEGVFREVDPAATATLLIAVPDSAGLTQHTLGDENVVERLRTALNELLFGALLADDVAVEREELL
jgi:AcrR family transcriptional regulator